MENSNKNKFFGAIRIDENPMNSKLVHAAITNTDPHKMVHMCISELMKEVELNTFDIPLYLCAIEILRQSLMDFMNSSDDPEVTREIYNMLKEKTTVITHMTHIPNK